MITVEEQSFRMGSVWLAKGNKADVDMWIAAMIAASGNSLTKKLKVGDGMVSATIERAKP